MIYLWIVSLIWAFSFGLIKGQLTGLPSNYVTLIRMGLAFFVFLPFFRLSAFNKKDLLKLFALGAIQFGCMYILYIQSYQYLKGHEVALFTITTPFFVTLIYDVFQKKFHPWALLMVLVCLAGSSVMKYSEIQRDDFWFGFFLIQLANLCFALGQVGYKKLFEGKALDHKQAFAPMFLGGVCVALLAVFVTQTSYVPPSSKQWLVLIYLGVLSSGVCFFLWNLGATKAKAGTLAIMNNMKIPLAILCSVLFFGEQTNITTLAIGTVLIFLALFGATKPIKKITSRKLR